MVANTKNIKFPVFKDTEFGSLIAIEAMKSIPFEVRRVYYIYAVPNSKERGFHSHNMLEQVLICVNGSVKIYVSTPGDSDEIILDSPEKGLYIGPMVWRVMSDFSSDAVLLVLASEHFNEADYIRDYDLYTERANKYFSIPK